jgi:outer membrane lipoprotein-sorting protein
MSYSWTSDPVGFTSTMANPLVIPSGTTKYYLTVSDGQRTATDSVLITTYSCAARSANIFPNPSNNQITINLDQNTVLPVQFHLISSSGTQLLSRTFNNLSNVIPVSGYDAGIYFYTIQSTDVQILHSGRILIQH